MAEEVLEDVPMEVQTNNEDDKSLLEMSDSEFTEKYGEDAIPEEIEQAVETTSNSEEPEQSAPDEEIDYKGFYEKVMTPFTANGTTITLQNPEEAVKLMQMGANYTKKMQAIAPYRKTIEFLKKENMLDDTTLSYLSDLNQHNKEAIKKLIKDSNIEFYELDPSREDEGETPYVPVNKNNFTDQQIIFRDKVDEINSTPEGHALIQTIHSSFDNESINALADRPYVLDVLATHHKQGIFDHVAKEIQRREIFDESLKGKPFLQKYFEVGDALFGSQQQQQVQAPQPQPVMQSYSPPTLGIRKAPVSSTAHQIKAMASPRTNQVKVKQNNEFDPLNLSDEEFERQFGNMFL